RSLSEAPRGLSFTFSTRALPVGSASWTWLSPPLSVMWIKWRMHVQRVAMLASWAESWTVLGDDDITVGPVEGNLAYLTAIGRSPPRPRRARHGSGREPGQPQAVGA